MKAQALRDFGMPRINQMRSKTMTIMAAAVLFLPTIAHAQPSEGRGIYHRDDLTNARADIRADRKPTPRDSSGTVRIWQRPNSAAHPNVSDKKWWQFW